MQSAESVLNFQTRFVTSVISGLMHRELKLELTRTG